MVLVFCNSILFVVMLYRNDVVIIWLRLVCYMMSLIVNIEKIFEVFMGCSLMILILFDRKLVRVEM